MCTLVEWEGEDGEQFISKSLLLELTITILTTPKKP
jgi:hypothetical protein